MLRTLVLILILAGAPTAGFAQTGPLAGNVMAELQSLDLSAAQKQQLMGIAMAAKARQQSIVADQQALLEVAETELSAGSADLIELTAQQQAITDRRIAAARTTRDDLLAFYAGLNTNQQTQVQTWLATALARIDAARTLAAMFEPLANLP